MSDVFARLDLKVSFALVSFMRMQKINLNISVSRQGKYTKKIWNYIEMLKTYNFVWSVLEFSCAYNPISDDNDKLNKATKIYTFL